MPVYQYACESCGCRFEISQSMLDATLDECPDCGGRVNRIISGGNGFILRRSDFHTPVRTHCGETQTCCGSRTPCETPSCGHQ